MDAETDIKRLNDLILQYEEAGDTEKLDPLLAQDFMIIRASGVKQDRQVFLDAVPDNKNRGRRASHAEVRLFGESALFTCLVTTTKTQDGALCERHFTNSRMFVWKAEKWLCVAWQVTETRNPLNDFIYFSASEPKKYGAPDRSKMCGDGRIEDLENVPPCPRMRAQFVKFTSGAHTRWHRHDGEQILYAYRGKGFVQLKGQENIQFLNEGDRVYVPAGLWHRHGALPGDNFNHLAITTGVTQWEAFDPLDGNGGGCS